MGSYEMILVLNPEIEEKQQKELLKEILNYIKQFAKVTRKEIDGLKNLAYEIKGHKRGIFVYIDFEINLADSNFYSKDDLERKLKLDERIIKFMIMREVQ